MKPAGFIGELKRRKVFRSCALYVVGCWAVLQIGDILFPILAEDENQVFRYLLYGAVGLFPVVILLSWFFQLSSRGIERTQAFIERRIAANIPPLNDRRKLLADDSGKVLCVEDYVWTISAQSGPLKNLTYGVSGILNIGRALDCDLTILSPQISRYHARLDGTKDMLTIEDLGSANGTMINGEKVKGKQLLHNEDKLQFLDIEFLVSRNYNIERDKSSTMDKTILFSRDSEEL